jgi:hypothetical protein
MSSRLKLFGVGRRKPVRDVELEARINRLERERETAVNEPLPLPDFAELEKFANGSLGDLRKIRAQAAAILTIVKAAQQKAGA